MIHVDPSLFLKRLVVVSYTGVVAYDQSFHKGVNIIRGQNSSGKSTIANFIFYILGGDFHSWTTEAAKCREVFAEVLVNDAVLTLKRSVNAAPHQPMNIYWGDYESSKQDSIRWQTYPYRQTENRISFSKVLFGTLNFPEVRTDEDANITMHQILRLLYIDQDTPTQSLFRSERFDPPLTRQTVAEILLGLYDDSLYGDRVSLRDSEKVHSEMKSQYEGMKRALSQAGELSLSDLQRSLEDANLDLDKLDAEISKTKNQRTVQASRKNALPLSEIQDEFQDTKKQVINVNRQIQELEVDIFDSVQFVATLQRRIKELDYSLITRKYLGELTLTHCPNCLNKLTEIAPEGHCFLCKQPLGEEAERTNAKKLKQELELQVKESTGLLESKNARIRELRAGLPAMIERAKLLQKRLDQAAKTSQSTRDEKEDELLIQKGRLEQQIAYITNRIKTVSILSQLRQELSEMAAKIDSLKLQIKDKEETQAIRYQAAFNRIRAYTLELLQKDLPRQAEFKKGNLLEVNFQKDTYSLDGSNNFSASSKIYFKNSILYSIFFASLDLDFMRYPRFILCDNMEDKGMEKERSQNFQKLIVQISQTSNTEHQIIFTTSMVADELNNTPLCVGEFYTDQNKTLKFLS